VELALKIILGIITAICFLGGLNLMTKGAKSFLPETLPPQPRLDNLFRFLSGIYFALGFLMLWVTIQSSGAADLLYFIGVIVFFSGVGRLYSRLKVGSAGTYYDSMMILEFVLGLSIILLNYLGH
jgi:hypothetical protein